MTILLLAGSPSIPSRSTLLLTHVGARLAQLGHRYSMLHVLDLPAEALLHVNVNNADIKQARAQVAQAEAVIVSTPVCKAAYSGILKAFLDVLPQDGLAGKLVLPLATGGGLSHMLALDYALRPVLSALGARHILPSIYATEAQINWSVERGITLDPTIARLIDEGIEHLFANLPASSGPATEGFSSVPFARVRSGGHVRMASEVNL